MQQTVENKTGLPERESESRPGCIMTRGAHILTDMHGSKAFLEKHRLYFVSARCIFPWVFLAFFCLSVSVWGLDRGSGGV